MNDSAGDRTQDPQIKSLLLYLLSYAVACLLGVHSREGKNSYFRDSPPDRKRRRELARARPRRSRVRHVELPRGAYKMEQSRRLLFLTKVARWMNCGRPSRWWNLMSLPN